MPIDMNGNDILKASHYLHGYLITNLSDKTFIINGKESYFQVGQLSNKFKFYIILSNLIIQN